MFALQALPHTQPRTHVVDLNWVRVDVVAVPPGTDILVITGLDMWACLFPPSVETVGLLQLLPSTHKPLRLGCKPQVVQSTVTVRPVKTNFDFLAGKLRRATHLVVIDGQECYVRTFPHETKRVVEINGKECEVLFFSREVEDEAEIAFTESMKRQAKKAHE